MKYSKNLIIAAIIGLVLLFSVPGIAFEIRYYDKVYPGIRLGSVDMGGSNENESRELMSAKVSQLRTIALAWGVNKWKIDSAQIGVNYDIDKSVDAAIKAGRSGNIGIDARLKIGLAKNNLIINPVFTIDTTALDSQISSISAEIDIPEKEPEVVFDNVKKIVDVTPGENGQKVDQALLKQRVITMIRNIDTEEVNIPVIELKPKLSNEQVLTNKLRAATILGKNLLITDKPENKSWNINDEQILSWMNLQTGKWKDAEISKWVSELAQNVDRPPQNATFRFVNSSKVEEFKPAREGRVVKQATVTQEVESALNKLVAGQEPQVEVLLEVGLVDPEISTAEVNSYGIKELLGKGESWFSGSITNRIFNLKKAAEAINGVMVAPGEEFSFNQAVGEVSANTGYKQAYIIKDGKTILGDGGGVCQVSSTLFRAVLAAGLPIPERKSHAYRVHYYEEKYQPGFDATVFQPSPDFKFKNDTQAHLLIQTIYNEAEKHLTFELYGTNDGRVVETSKARIWDQTPPPPELYQDDPTLTAGKIVQTEHAAWGAKVAFDWKVTRGDDILQEKTFYSNYQPWQAVFLRGTKTN